MQGEKREMKYSTINLRFIYFLLNKALYYIKKHMKPKKLYILTKLDKMIQLWYRSKCLLRTEVVYGNIFVK